MDKTHDEGRIAHRMGLPRWACRHPEGSKEHLEWLGGWGEAMIVAARGEHLADEPEVRH